MAKAVIESFYCGPPQLCAAVPPLLADMDKGAILVRWTKIADGQCIQCTYTKGKGDAVTVSCWERQVEMPASLLYRKDFLGTKNFRAHLGKGPCQALRQLLTSATVPECAYESP